MAVTCKYPGCENPPEPAAAKGRPPEYCADQGHNAVSAWRARRRPADAERGVTTSEAESGDQAASEVEQEECLDHLYVIGEGGSCGIVKIGRSVRPAARLGEIQVGNPRKVQLLLVVPEAGRYEDAVHREFSSRRLGGEWFDLDEGDPVERVQHALDGILRAELESHARRSATTIPRLVPEDGTGHHPLCTEAGCNVRIFPLLDAANQWFLDNHPDPAAYLLEQGFAWHCIWSVLGDGLPELSQRTIRKAAGSARGAQAEEFAQGKMRCDTV